MDEQKRLEFENDIAQVDKVIDAATDSRIELEMAHGNRIAAEDVETAEEEIAKRTPATWFAVLREPTPDYLTRVVRADKKIELKKKLLTMDARNIEFVIRGHNQPFDFRAIF